ncbi:hypothetical protein T439DRAFT_378049 [Meredithblackwellia eburnea MCA 4105]
MSDPIISSRPATPAQSSLSLSQSQSSSSQSPASPAPIHLVSRPSSLSLRPHLIAGQAGRLRARSITSTSLPSTPPALPPHLSPTLVGSPVLPPYASFLQQPDPRSATPSDAHSPPSSQHQQHRNAIATAVGAVSMVRKDSSSGGEDDDEMDYLEAETGASTSTEEEEEEEEDGSTLSEFSPPATPADDRKLGHPALANFRSSGGGGGGGGGHPVQVGQEYEGEEEDSQPWPYEITRGKGKVVPVGGTKLEGSTRLQVRRGRSFTSLLIPPPSGSPLAMEKGDPFSSLSFASLGAAPVLADIVERQTPSPPSTSSSLLSLSADLSTQPTSPTIASSLSDLEAGEIDRPPTPRPFAVFPPLAPTSKPVVGASAASHGSLSSSTTSPKNLRSFAPQLGLLLVLFLSSLCLIFLLISTLPNLFIPHSLSDLPTLTSAMTTYRSSSPWAEAHLFIVLSGLFLWKQCFSVPGSILTNILFGALYGTGFGTFWACIWTAGGSTGAYFIARVIAPLVEHYFATPLRITRQALNLPQQGSTAAGYEAIPLQPISGPVAPGAVGTGTTNSDLFTHLLLARFFPLLPYSVLNVIAGVLGLPVSYFFATLVIGSFPFNFATVSIGELVALAASASNSDADMATALGDKIWSPAVMRKLVLVTLISVLPVVFKKRIQAFAESPQAKAMVGGLGTSVKFWYGRLAGAIVRRLFGFGSVSVAGQGSSGLSVGSGGPSAGGRLFTTSRVRSATTPGSGKSMSSGQWRRKFNPSWGGGGYRMERVGDVLSRWDGDEGDERAQEVAQVDQERREGELA